MNAQRQFTLRTLWVIITCVCTLSGVIYYVRTSASNLFRYSHYERAEADLDWELQINFLNQIANDAVWRKKLADNVQWYEDKLQNGTEDEREGSALILGELVKPDSIAEVRLIEALDSSSARVKRAAIFSLGAMGSVKSRPKLLLIVKGTDKRLANEAQIALVKLQKLELTHVRKD